MKNAIVNFENLGYELTNYDERWVVYEKQTDGEYLTIRFHLLIKTVSVSFNFISSQELNAIYQQMKALGWIE